MTEDENNFDDDFSDEIEFEYEDEDWGEVGGSLEDSGNGSDGGDDDSEDEIGTTNGSDDHSKPLETNFYHHDDKFCKNVPTKSWLMEDFINQQFMDRSYSMQKHDLPHLTIDEILAMLVKENLQHERVVSEFYGNREAFLKGCGLMVRDYVDGKADKDDKEDEGDTEDTDDIDDEDNEDLKVPGFKKLYPLECPICCEQESSTYSLACGHRYCCKCYSRYILDVYETVKGNVKCPGCELTIPIADMCQLTGKKPDSTGYRFFLEPIARRFIDKATMRYRWCPAPDCVNLVEIKYKFVRDLATNLKNVPIVYCNQGHEFCFSCGYENHLPCPCVTVDDWIKKCSDDSQTARWLDNNSQPCPNCSLNIEKNGGCNHMKCWKCMEEFCWICLRSWSRHSLYYNCNQYNPEEVESRLKTASLERQTIQRYAHFYLRFAIHESSMAGDAKTWLKVEEKMITYLETRKDKDISWIDVQFLDVAIKQLTNGRKTLKWTYAFAYYLKNSNFAQIFEEMQNYLNQSVEDLLRIFEQINDKENKNVTNNFVVKHKKKIKNLSRLIVMRQQNMVECAYHGLNQGLLKLE